MDKKEQNSRLEDMANGLGQYVRPEWADLPRYSSDSEAVAENYIRTLEKHSKINPKLIDRIIEHHLNDSGKK